MKEVNLINVITTIKLYNSRNEELKSSCSDVMTFWQEIKKYKNYADLMSESDFKDVLKAVKQRKMKRYRTRKKVQDLLYMPHLTTRKSSGLFGTATFSNKTLYKNNGEPIKIETLNKKINEYIKKYFEVAVINIDFGEKNERVHFHWVGIPRESVELISTNKKSKKGFELYNIENDEYDLGFLPTYEFFNFDDTNRVSDYLLKLNNHSSKTTTKNYRIRVIGNKKIIEEIKSLKRHLKAISR